MITCMCRIWTMWNTRKLNQSIIKKRTSQPKCCQQYCWVSVLLYGFIFQLAVFIVCVHLLT